jgi:hypothetical protein
MKTPAVTMVAADQRRDRRRTSMASGNQVQQELGGFAHCAHEQQQADQRQRVGVPAEEVDGLAGQCRRAGEDGLEVGRADQHEDREDAEREAEIADPIDHEGLDGGGVRRRLLVPESDQEVAGETDALPAEVHLHEVVCGHQHQHREGEQRKVSEEPRPVRILVHVADRIEVHERRHGVDHHQHHGRQRINPQRPRHLQVAGIDPGEQRDPRVMVHEADVDQSHQTGRPTPAAARS